MQDGLSPVEKVLGHLEKYTERRNGEFRTRCPAHSGTSADSLSIKEGDDGRALLYCHAGCEQQEIVGALDLGVVDLFADNGKPAAKKATKKAAKGDRPEETRVPANWDDTQDATITTDDLPDGDYYGFTSPAGEILYIQRHKGPYYRKVGDDLWKEGLKGYVEPVLYNLHELLEGVRASKTVLHLEGCKDVETARERLAEFVDCAWGDRLIRAWDEGWMDAPTELGDTLGRVVLGAAPGQTVVADSTTDLFYKLVRAAVDAAPDGRDEIVCDAANFPTDRYVLEGLARDRDREIAWLDPDPIEGPTTDDVASALAAHPGDVALVTLSHVNYRSAAIADLGAITALAHEAGALVLWDLSHSAGSVPVDLDDHDVDPAVGCTYKYLNGGAGAPAYLYIRRDLQAALRNPIQGWFGQAEQFEMGQGFRPRPGIAGWLTGTPGILGLVAAEEGIRLSVEAGIGAIRSKGIALTEYAIALHDAWLAPLGFGLGSPRPGARRGSHVSIRRSDARALTRRMIEAGVIPDFRAPDSIRIGLSPLTTSFRDVARGLANLRDLAAAAGPPAD
jgi:kynureninase